MRLPVIVWMHMPFAKDSVKVIVVNTSNSNWPTAKQWFLQDQNLPADVRTQIASANSMGPTVFSGQSVGELVFILSTINCKIFSNYS